MKQYIVKRTNTAFNKINYMIDVVDHRMVSTNNKNKATVFTSKKAARELLSEISKQNRGYYDHFEIVTA